MTVWAAVIVAVTSAAGPLRADPIAEQIRKAREAALNSSVVVSYYVERDDGVRADIRMLGTVVGPDNLVMFTSAAISSQFALSQFHDFKLIVTKGDDIQTYAAEYLGKDDLAQVAFLRVTDPKAPKLPPLEFQTGVTLEIGDPVLSFTSLGEPDGYARVIHLSRVGARIDQPVTLWLTAEGLGAPGTPVVTLDGKAMGIVGFTRLNRGTNARPNWSLGEVIWPAERFMERLKNPPKGGSLVKRPWIGVQTVTPVTKDLAEYYKLGDRRGVVIGQIVEGGPAEKAGIKAEDLILALDGKDLKGTEGQLVENFTNNLRERKIGDTVAMEIWRAGKTETLKVTLVQEPKSAAEAERYKNTQVGLGVREMVTMDRLQRELPASESGVVVSFLDPAGWARDGGLQAGDIVKKVQDQDVKTLADFRRVFDAEIKKKPKEIVLFVLRGKKDTQLVRIETHWDAAEKPKADTPGAPKPDAGGDKKPVEKKSDAGAPPRAEKAPK
jgi:serine protease Do